MTESEGAVDSNKIPNHSNGQKNIPWSLLRFKSKISSGIQRG